MARNGGTSAGKVILNVILTVVTIAVLLVLAVLIYCSVKGLTFGDGFLEMFSFLSKKETVDKTKETAETITNLCLYR